VKISGSQPPTSLQFPEIPATAQKEIKTDSSVASAKPVASAEPRLFQPDRLAALSLPPDRLSTLIIELARFFSLPLEPGLLAKIRREAKPGLEQAARPETLSLAATAAADKGVELTQAALKKYASALSLDPERENASKEGKKAETENFNSLLQNPSKLKDYILQTADRSPLLRLMNQLPGRNGQRWLALPFHFSSPGAEYSACLKILLDGVEGGKAGRMALELCYPAAPDSLEFCLPQNSSTNGGEFPHSGNSKLKMRSIFGRTLPQEPGGFCYPAAPDSLEFCLPQNSSTNGGEFARSANALPLFGEFCCKQNSKLSGAAG
jgi:hypothetical protein